MEPQGTAANSDNPTLLYHAFVQPAGSGIDGARPKPTQQDDCRSLKVLESILEYGLLCTPEKYKFYPHPKTRSPTRQAALRDGKEYEVLTCSRACFTLMERTELSKVYQVSPRPDDSCSHSDLFGRFAIGLDPIEARAFGVMPVMYYHTTGASSRQKLPSDTSNVGNLLQHRLDELRSIVAVLCCLEAREIGGPSAVPSIEQLEQMGVHLNHEHEVREPVLSASESAIATSMRHFNTDRVPAWQIADFMALMLSLFQTADSDREHAPLAFFRQREWRLVPFSHPGFIRYCLGPHPKWMDPYAVCYSGKAKAMRRRVFENRPRDVNTQDVKPPSSWARFFRHSWVVDSLRGRQFRNWIREIIVPENYIECVQEMLTRYEWQDGKPKIHKETPRWSLDISEGMPAVMPHG
jgi:hypothetical protein